MDKKYMHNFGSFGSLPIIDMRSEDDICMHSRPCIIGSAHIPLAEWKDRSLEFPPRGNPFALLVPSYDEETQAVIARVRNVFLESLAVLVVDCCRETDVDTLESCIQGRTFWETVPAERVMPGPLPFPCKARLWAPSPLALTLVSLLPRADELHILDAGAGTGRNAIFLLHELPAATVTAVDNRRAIIEKLSKFADREGLSGRLRRVKADVAAVLAGSRGHERGGEEKKRDQERYFQVVAFFRFVDKPSITRCLLSLRPGSCGSAWIVVEGFHTSSPHPKDPTQLLEFGEVLPLLAQSDPTWRMQVVHEQLASADDGRPLLQVIVKITVAS